MDDKVFYIGSLSNQGYVTASTARLHSTARHQPTCQHGIQFIQAAIKADASPVGILDAVSGFALEPGTVARRRRRGLAKEAGEFRCLEKEKRSI